MKLASGFVLSRQRKQNLFSEVAKDLMGSVEDVLFEQDVRSTTREIQGFQPVCYFLRHERFKLSEKMLNVHYETERSRVPPVGQVADHEHGQLLQRDAPQGLSARDQSAQALP